LKNKSNDAETAVGPFAIHLVADRLCTAVPAHAGHATMHDNQADNVRLIRDFLQKQGL